MSRERIILFGKAVVPLLAMLGALGWVAWQLGWLY